MQAFRLLAVPGLKPEPEDAHKAPQLHHGAGRAPLPEVNVMPVLVLTDMFFWLLLENNHCL